MRSELRTLGLRLVVGSLWLFAGMSAEARGQAPDTRPNTPARLLVCNALADGRSLQGAAREEYLGDCLLLPVLATPPGIMTARPEEPPTRRPRAERDSAPPENAPQRPAPPRVEQNEARPPAPAAEPSPSAAAPQAGTAAAVPAGRPSVNGAIRIAGLVAALAVFGVSLLMMKIGGPVAAGLTSLALVVSLGVTALAFDVWRTVFNPDFAIAELEAADALGTLEKMLTGEGGGDPMQEVMRASFNDERPHITAQIGRAVHGLYDYVGGKNADVKLTFEPGTVKNTMARHLRARVAADAPANTPPEAVRQMADDAEREFMTGFDEMVGSSLTLASLPPEATQSLGALRRARPYLMWTLVGAGLLSLQCLLLLWLVGSPLWVGVVAIATGIILFATSFGLDRTALWALKTFGGELSTLMEPDAMLKVISHFWGPLRLFAVAALVVGVAAIAVSFLRPSAQPAASGAAR